MTAPFRATRKRLRVLNRKQREGKKPSSEIIDRLAAEGEQIGKSGQKIPFPILAKDGDKKRIAYCRVVEHRKCKCGSLFVHDWNEVYSLYRHDYKRARSVIGLEKVTHNATDLARYTVHQYTKTDSCFLCWEGLDIPGDLSWVREWESKQGELFPANPSIDKIMRILEKKNAN